MSRRHRENSIRVADSFSNPVFQLGYGTQAPLEGTQYPMTRMTQNYQLLNSLYRNNWIVQNIITTIPDDMMREWIKLQGVTPEAVDRMERTVRRAGLRRKLTEGMYWGRLYGGAVGLLMIKGQEDLEQPLDLDMVLPGSFQGLYIVDRWSGVYPENELVTNPGDPDFGLPAFYSIRDASGAIVMKVHHSRVVRFIGRELPYWEKIAEIYWGESEIEAIYDEIVKRDNVSNNMANLTFKAQRDYLEMDGVDQMFAMQSPQVQKRFWDMMQAQKVLDTNFGMRIVNKGDTMHNTQYTFTGLSDVYGSVMMDVSGASHIPVTKLFGRSPAGLNATGESDLQNYYDYVDTLREAQLRPAIERILPVMALSAWGENPEELDFTFPPLWTPKATEIADIADKKASAVITAYQAGILPDKSSAMKELKNLEDETGMFGSISDDDVDAAKGITQNMSDPLAGVM